jgi:starch phosphorylase
MVELRMSGAVDSPKDPVCGMPVDPAKALSLRLDGNTVYFCSELCRQEFLRRSGRHSLPVHEARASRRVAYFSMEIALDAAMPTYSGGLGVLAGDILRSGADLRVPVVAVTLVHRKGYFRQRLDDRGNQTEQPADWSPERALTALLGTVEVAIEGRPVAVRAWKHEIVGSSGYVVPVLLLDTDVPGNAEGDRHLTDFLYGGDERYRLAQEIVLGIGGVRALRAAGYDGFQKLHMNEGHASLAALELLREHGHGADGWDFAGVRERCVFTTHTPVAAGHDHFDWGLVWRVLGEPVPADVLAMLAGRERMNMTELALNASGFVNGVARRHGEVSQHMFPGRDIRSVTNGVHSATWTCDAFRALFDRHVPEWRDDPAMLRKAISIPTGEVRAAHAQAKERLFALVRSATGRVLSPDVLTVGFARRATGYKRADLVFRDVERLRALGRRRLQLVFAGKAHPSDGEGKDMIRRIVEMGRQLGDDVPVVYLPEYDVAQARTIVAGVDVWLNTPRPPLEASGTSGMKAAHNGVPSLSILDGWWIEGCVEGVTGWAVDPRDRESDDADARALYDKLESAVLPLFNGDPACWTSVMQHAIALNASFFNTHRVVQQYVTNAYLAAT